MFDLSIEKILKPRMSPVGILRLPPLCLLRHRMSILPYSNFERSVSTTNVPSAQQRVPPCILGWFIYS
ncbi:hypothetical protein RRG08_066750 [Elysia crispata]|uniref:Uncharacterized protein n=1 Tax=Elysia crispata TaxID=231223 RepID=A0AAE1CJS5_9GAST|nr:hypothetical protein RRG08_066750 [Elysia crispata]